MSKSKEVAVETPNASTPTAPVDESSEVLTLAPTPDASIMTVKDPCVLCGSEKARDIIKTDGNAIYSKCPECGTIKCQGTIEKVELNAAAEDRNTEPFHQARLQRILSLVDQGKQHELRVLDYGCGNGEFVEYLNQHGQQVQYTDENHKLHAQKYDFEAVGYDSETFKSFPSGKFDVITMTEVLSQLRDPAQALKQIKAALHPKGLVIIEGFYCDSITEVSWPTAPEITGAYGAQFIPSFKGLQLFMQAQGFDMKKAFNRNVCAFQKI